jgi:hypothetical protein
MATAWLVRELGIFLKAWGHHQRLSAASCHWSAVQLTLHTLQCSLQLLAVSWCDCVGRHVHALPAFMYISLLLLLLAMLFAHAGVGAGFNDLGGDAAVGLGRAGGGRGHRGMWCVAGCCVVPDDSA